MRCYSRDHWEFRSLGSVVSSLIIHSFSLSSGWHLVVAGGLLHGGMLVLILEAYLWLRILIQGVAGFAYVDFFFCRGRIEWHR